MNRRSSRRRQQHRRRAVAGNGNRAIKMDLKMSGMPAAAAKGEPEHKVVNFLYRIHIGVDKNIFSQKRSDGLLGLPLILKVRTGILFDFSSKTHPLSSR